MRCVRWRLIVMNSLRNRNRVLWIAVLLFVLNASALRAEDQAYFINGSQFGTIDLGTGASVILGTFQNFAQFPAGLGQIGGTLYTAGFTGGTLYTVNPKSGALNPVGPSSIIYWRVHGEFVLTRPSVFDRAHD